MATKTEEGNFYALDAPQKEGKDGYVGTYFSSRLNIDAILRSQDFNASPRKVYYQVLNIISTIQGEKARDVIYKELESRIEVLKADYKKVHEDVNIPPQDEIDLIIIASLKTLGSVTDYYGKFVPLTSENRIGYCLDDTQKVIIKEEEGEEDGE